MKCSVHTDLVLTILGDVAHPWESLVSTLLHDLEVADLHARHREVWNLKFDLDWHSAVFLSLDLCVMTVFCFS